MDDERVLTLLDSIFTSDGTVPSELYHKFWNRAKSDPRLSTVFTVSAICKVMSVLSGRDQTGHRSIRDDLEEFTSSANAEDTKGHLGLSDEEKLMNVKRRMTALFQFEKTTVRVSGTEARPQPHFLKTAVGDEVSLSTPVGLMGNKCRSPSEIAFVGSSLEAADKDDILPEFEKLSEVWQQRNPFWRTLMHTAFFCALYLPVSRHDFILQMALSYWSTHTRLLPLAEDLRYLLSLDGWDVIYRLTMIATNPDTMSGNFYSFHVAEDITLPYVTSPWIVYPRLEEMFCSGPEMMETLLNILIMMISHPEVPQNRLVNAMTIMQMLVQVRTDIPREKLEAIRRVVLPFVTWRVPFGSQALDLVSCVEHDLFLQGSTARQLALENARVSNDEDSDSHEEEEIDGSSGLVTSSSNSLRPKCVHILINKRAATAEQFLLHLKQGLKSNFAGDSGNISCSFASFFLDLLSCFPDTFSQDDIDTLRCIPLDRVARAYQLVGVDIMKIEMEIKNDYGRKQIETILRSAYDRLRGDIRRSCSLDEVTTAEEGEKQEGRKYLWKQSNCFRPLFVELNVIHLEDEFDLTQRPLIGRTQYASVHYDVLKDLLANWSLPGVDGARKVVDIAIAGGDGTLQHFVTAYAALASQNIEILEQMDINIFVVPLGSRNTLSSFVSQYDGFYRRHVHLPCQYALRFLPECALASSEVAGGMTGKSRRRFVVGDSSSDSGRDAVYSGGILDEDVLAQPSGTATNVTSGFGESNSTWKYSSPSEIHLDALYRYLTNSYVSTKVYVRRCECWRYEPQKGGIKLREYVLIPFVAFAEVGIGVTAQMFMQKNYEQFRGKPLADVISSRKFKYSPLEARLTITEAYPCDVPHKEDEIVEPCPYAMISVSGVHHFSNRGKGKASPSSTHLEIHTIEYDKRRKSAIPASDTFWHVSAIKIEPDPLAPVFVILDGEIYGPFHKLRFSSFELPGKASSFLTFNLKHFSELDV